VFLVKHGQKPLKYDNPMFSYQNLFDFINIHSETFVFKDTKEEETQSAAAKPWLAEAVP